MQNNWLMGRRWAVVQCVPNSEALAATSAAELGFSVFWPRYREKVVRSHRKAVERLCSYIPGYCFVSDAKYARDGRPLSLWELGKAKGVASVLKVGSEYATVADTDPVFRVLMSMADDRGFVAREEAKKPITLFKTSETVMLKNCPFELFPAVIDMIDESRNGAWVWVQMFGGRSRVHVDYNQLEKIV